MSDAEGNGTGAAAWAAAPAVDGLAPMLKQLFVESRWMPLVELACAIVSGILWSTIPSFTWQPLVIGLLPRAIRLVARQFPFKRTILDLPLAVFLLTAAAGVWASYERALALNKFWLIVGAVLIYYALAGQPQSNLWPVAVLVAAFGTLLSGYFVMTHDWQVNPADIGFIDQLALRWMSIRPLLGLSTTDTHVVGGVIAVTLPFVVAVGIRARAEGRKSLQMLAIACGAIAAGGCLLAGQRGAWLGVIVVGGIGVWWWLSGVAGERRRAMFRPALTVAVAASIVWVLIFPAQVLRVVAPGNRLEVILNTFRLAADFPFTGGGLMSFAGLYSRYILLIPSLFLPHSYNLFLNTAVEQGLPGLIALLGVMTISLWRLSAASQPSATQNLLRWAVFSALLIIIVYSLVEDPFYSGWGTLLLFAVVGLGTAATPTSVPTERARRWSSSWQTVVATSTVIVALGVVLGFRPLLSAWYANLGAVEMARMELAGWPEAPHYRGDFDAAELDAAEALLMRSRELDSGNRTANFRLGLVAARRGSDEAAATYWVAAYRADQGHRGVQKMLGYTYVWLGRYTEATVLLVGIPEAEDEMQTYSWWWGTQGRDDLAEHAAQMATLLASQ